MVKLRQEVLQKGHLIQWLSPLDSLLTNGLVQLIGGLSFIRVGCTNKKIAFSCSK